MWLFAETQASGWTTFFQAVQALSVVIGIGISLRALNQWKSEHLGKKTIDMAEELLILFYQARDAIREIRFPDITAVDLERVERMPNEPLDVYKSRLYAVHLLNRLHHRAEVFQRLESERFRFMARFGGDIESQFTSVMSIYAEIKKAAMQIQHEIANEIEKRFTENREIRYETVAARISEETKIAKEDLASETPDRLEQKLSETVKAVEDICRPIIQAANE